MSLEIFKTHFYAEYESITKELDKFNENSQSGIDLINEYDLIGNRIHLIQNYVTDNTPYLNMYEQRKAQENLNKLSQYAAQIRAKVFPKKKFEFKAKKNLVKTTVAEEKVVPETKVIEDTESVLLNNLHTCNINNLENVTIVKNEGEILNADIGIFNLKNCIVKLKGTPSVLHIKNIENTIILCGPLFGTAFISEAKNSKLNLACHQLRIHDSMDTDFYINVSSRAIIENCQRVRFGPYAWKYTNIEGHFSSGLNLHMSDDNWKLIDDFNWLVSTQQSPNWSFIPEEDREKWRDD